MLKQLLCMSPTPLTSSNASGNDESTLNRLAFNDPFHLQHRVKHAAFSSILFRRVSIALWRGRPGQRILGSSQTWSRPTTTTQPQFVSFPHISIYLLRSFSEMLTECNEQPRMNCSIGMRKPEEQPSENHWNMEVFVSVKLRHYVTDVHRKPTDCKKR